MLTARATNLVVMLDVTCGVVTSDSRVHSSDSWLIYRHVHLQANSLALLSDLKCTDMYKALLDLLVL